MMESEVDRLAATPLETDQAYWRAVIEARLVVGEASIAAAHAAMMHCGARGYVTTGAAQRRLRESYFVAIVTPAIKQLKKMLADMAH
jgi:alkylation response protein AidB-like acyl-CoA dehydrogenase